jgi:hypothetical protein
MASAYTLSQYLMMLHLFITYINTIIAIHHFQNKRRNLLYKISVLCKIIDENAKFV